MSVDCSDCRAHPDAYAIAPDGTLLYQSQLAGDAFVPGEDNKARYLAGDRALRYFPTSEVFMCGQCGSKSTGGSGSTTPAPAAPSGSQTPGLQVTGNPFSFLSQSTILGGVPNWMLLAGGYVGLKMLGRRR